MVRLSLIVLGLLAAAWCFTGSTDGVRVSTHRRHTHLSCRYRQKISVSCSRIRSSYCSKVTITRGSVKYISRRSAGYVKNCRRRRSCQFDWKKGPYVCKYRCVRARKVCRRITKNRRRCRYV